MSLRFIGVVFPDAENADVAHLADDEAVTVFGEDRFTDGQLVIKIILPAEKTEQFMEQLEQRYSSIEGFRAIMFPVEATLPLYEMEVDAAELRARRIGKKVDKGGLRISKEELYSEISDRIKPSRIYLSLVILSSVVAAVGLLRNSIAIVIGAMVIAPLLGPNVGMAFATALGDQEFGRKAFRTSVYGIGIALLLSMLIGFIFNADTAVPSIVSRTTVNLSDIILALAAGCAGVLSITSGVSTALIGVMVAVALLPPLVVLGLLLGVGEFSLALGAFLLLLANLICINLSGVATFYIQGVHPRNWWEAERAKKASKRAIIIWTGLLVALVVVIYLSR
jgi:uncharacterized hydrophobic protein (TIGR00341 family)